MSLRCRLFGHDLVAVRFTDEPIGFRTTMAQCHRCGFTVAFETKPEVET